MCFHDAVAYSIHGIAARNAIINDISYIYIYAILNIAFIKCAASDET